MSQDNDSVAESPLEGGATTLEVTAWHLQVLLTSLAGFDGKIMFLTALNVAAISALIGSWSHPTLRWSWLRVGSRLQAYALGLGSEIYGQYMSSSSPHRARH